MRPRRSTVVVFVVVAAVWFGTHLAARIEFEALRDDPKLWRLSQLEDDLSYLVFAWQCHPLYRIYYWLGGNDFVTHMVYSPRRVDRELVTVFQVTNALAASALIVSAVVLVRRLHGRRTASKVV